MRKILNHLTDPFEPVKSVYLCVNQDAAVLTYKDGQVKTWRGKEMVDLAIHIFCKATGRPYLPEGVHMDMREGNPI